jgi:hypothetical protein
MKARATARETFTQRAAAATDPYVANVARDALSRGNAIDAVLTAVLVAAARSPAVFLGSLQALVGGAGAGLLAVDGRVRQPGAGVRRPRGFVGEQVPDTAKIGVPGLPAAVATLVASVGAASLLQVAGPAVDEARAHSADRARSLQAFARRGAPAVAQGFLAEELTATAGRAAQGLLTGDDLAAAKPAVTRCDPDTLPGKVLKAPWRERADATSCHVVMAIDGKGMAAVACYEDPPGGLQVPNIGLALPFSAEPVLRGKPRVRPGALRPAAAPIALRLANGIADLCVGVGRTAGADGQLDAILAEIARDVAPAVALDAVTDGSPVALVRTGERVRAFG